MKKSLQIMIVFNLFLLAGIGGLLLFGFNSGSKAIMDFFIASSTSKAGLHMYMKDDVPVIEFLDSKGAVTLSLKGGAAPGLDLCGKAGHLAASLNIAPEGHAALMLHDAKGAHRLLLQGGGVCGLCLFDNKERLIANFSEAPSGGAVAILRDNQQMARILLEGGARPGIYVLNQKSETMASIAQLNDGGGIGLARDGGTAAAVLRGGDNPGAAFFLTGETEPEATIGITKNMPYMMISGTKQKDGVLVHGGKPSGMALLSEKGEIKLLISKDGVFQDKQPIAPKKHEYFTFEEQNQLFPREMLEGGISR